MKMKLDEINWIRENEFEIHPNISIEEQTNQLLEYLGSPDSQLREGSLEILCSWILKGYFSAEKLLELAHILKENLIFGLGEQNTDTVFLRSFSALVLGDIITFDENCALQMIKERKPYLTRELITDFLRTSLEYYREEKDTRGYVDFKGWSHSIAHGADLFKCFAQHRFVEKDELMRILDVLILKINEPQMDVYKAREEMRITVAIYTVFLRRILETEEIIEWFQGFEEAVKNRIWHKFVKDPSILNAQLNLRAFLNCMYFMVKNGISNSGYYDSDFYKDNLLKDRVEIAAIIESLILQMDRIHYFVP